MSIQNPHLERRLNVSRMEAMFEEHLDKVFGDGHAKFTPQLRNHLREFWELALHAELPVDIEMSVGMEDELLRRVQEHGAFVSPDGTIMGKS